MDSSWEGCWLLVHLSGNSQWTGGHSYGQVIPMVPMILVSLYSTHTWGTKQSKAVDHVFMVSPIPVLQTIESNFTHCPLSEGCEHELAS